MEVLLRSGHPEARNSDGGDQSGIQVMGYFPGESVPLSCILNVKKSATVAIVWFLKWRLHSALFLLNY